MAHSVTTTRKALYQRLWSEPVLKLAKEHGLSDVGFAKLCKRNEIPRPPRGFWARKVAGQNPRTEPLPRPEADWEIQITPFGKPIADPKLRAGIEKELAQSVPAEPIMIPESLRGAHPLVSQSLHALEFAEKGEHGLVRPPAVGCLDVWVSKDSLRRALRIMDAIITTFEASGHRVKVLEGKDVPRTLVELMETAVPFGIHELLVEKKEEVDGGAELKGKYEFHYSRFKTKTAPSGKLCLEIEPRRRYYHSRDGRRRKWSDSQRGRIESYLNDFVAGVIKVATSQRDAELAYKREERARLAAAKLAQEREAARAAMWAKIQAERAKVAKLQAAAVDWDNSRQLRAYIEAVRQDAASQGKDISDGSEMDKWLRWATAQADRLDPLKESPPSILDDEAKYKAPEQPRFW